ncbi:MAG: sel1 repeat family protein [Nannocystaceae bacterium]|nr:sel1 repeat family protein [Nannocystaceae bacterium]
MTSPEAQQALQRGRALFDNFVRGDAVIGLIADVPGTERTMMEQLWTAAQGGSSAAYRTIAQCYFAVLRTLGAFEGIDPADADARPWSAAAQAIEDDNPALQASLRAWAEAARLGDREATLQFARLSRHASAQVQRLALASLQSLADPQPAEVYQTGLVHHWLDELDAAYACHRRAAEAGDADAMFELYIVFAQGLAVDPDPEASQAWLDRAAAAEHPRALYNLGAAWASGSNGTVDMAKAAQYYTRAADRGNGRAAATLAIMILGEEIDGTAEQAARWLDRADEAGYPSWEMLEATGFDDPRASP